jgi:lysophospholipase L1-like esterase
VRRLNAWLVVLSISIASIVAGVVFAVDSPSAWMSSASPTLQKVVDLPDNVPPAQTNIDCDKITTRLADSSTMQEDCVMQTPLGLAGDKGVIFTGASEAVPIVAPPPFIGLHPIPNQQMLYTYSSSSVFGMYMQFYKTIRDKLKPSPDFINGSYQYPLTKGPDFVLKNLAGNSQPMNPESLAFSQNGDWMILDFQFQGFVRVNLATFDMVPFAPSMNNGSDYASYNAQATISNDGRYVAVKSGNAKDFKVYDIASCAGAVLPVDAANPKCQSRSYWQDLNSQLPGLQALYQPRFTSDMQLSVTAQYAYSGGKYKAAQYTLTAPGENPSGIEYLSMGDSYASGQGAFNYIAGTDTANNPCHLSSLSYPFLLSASLFNSGHSIACSGAETEDIVGNSNEYTGRVNDGIRKKDRKNIDEIIATYSPGYLLQSDFVQKHNPSAITLSIGGNDVGFEDIVTRCVTPAVVNSTCYPTKEDQQEIVERILNTRGKLQSTYRAVNGPSRRVYIIGYPQIVVNGGSCANNVHLNEQEIKLFIDLTDLLNQTIQTAAAVAGAQYIDVSNAFIGHRMCETKSSNLAVNGLTGGTDTGFGAARFIGAESYHPNVLGHELLKQSILGQTNNLKAYAKTTQPSLIPPTLPSSSAPSTGRVINLTITNNLLTPDTIASLSTLSLNVESSVVQLKASSSYSVRLDAATASVGTATTDITGQFTGTISVPGDLPCGPHTVHIIGLNIINQPIDIYKEVYIAPQNAGCGGAQSKCGVVADSGSDIDKDGIDDACDPLISDPPTGPAYSVYLTGSSIHASKVGAAVPAPQQVEFVSENTNCISPLSSSANAQHSRDNYEILFFGTLFGITLGYLYIKGNKYKQVAGSLR